MQRLPRRQLRAAAKKADSWQDRGDAEDYYSLLGVTKNAGGVAPLLVHSLRVQQVLPSFLLFWVWMDGHLACLSVRCLFPVTPGSISVVLAQQLLDVGWPPVPSSTLRILLNAATLYLLLRDRMVLTCYYHQ